MTISKLERFSCGSFSKIIQSLRGTTAPLRLNGERIFDVANVVENNLKCTKNVDGGQNVFLSGTHSNWRSHLRPTGGTTWERSIRSTRIEMKLTPSARIEHSEHACNIDDPEATVLNRQEEFDSDCYSLKYR